MTHAGMPVEPDLAAPIELDDVSSTHGLPDAAVLCSEVELAGLWGEAFSGEIDERGGDRRRLVGDELAVVTEVVAEEVGEGEHGDRVWQRRPQGGTQAVGRVELDQRVIAVPEERHRPHVR